MKFRFYNEYFPEDIYEDWVKRFDNFESLLSSHKIKVLNTSIHFLFAAKNDYNITYTKLQEKIINSGQNFMPISDKYISINDIVKILQDTASEKEQAFCDKYKDDKFNFNGRSISALLSNEESVEKYLQSTFKNALKMILSKTNVNSYATQQAVMKNVSGKNQFKPQNNYGKSKFILQSSPSGNTTSTRVVTTKSCKCGVPGWVMFSLAIIGTFISGTIAFVKRKRARNKSKFSTIV